MITIYERHFGKKRPTYAESFLDPAEVEALGGVDTRDEAHFHQTVRQMEERRPADMITCVILRKASRKKRVTYMPRQRWDEVMQQKERPASKEEPCS